MITVILALFTYVLIGFLFGLATVIYEVKVEGKTKPVEADYGFLALCLIIWPIVAPLFTVLAFNNSWRRFVNWLYTYLSGKRKATE